MVKFHNFGIFGISSARTFILIGSKAFRGPKKIHPRLGYKLLTHPYFHSIYFDQFFFWSPISNFQPFASFISYLNDQVWFTVWIHSYNYGLHASITNENIRIIIKQEIWFTVQANVFDCIWIVNHHFSSVKPFLSEFDLYKLQHQRALYLFGMK